MAEDLRQELRPDLELARPVGNDAPLARPRVRERPLVFDAVNLVRHKHVKGPLLMGGGVGGHNSRGLLICPPDPAVAPAIVNHESWHMPTSCQRDDGRYCSQSFHPLGLGIVNYMGSEPGTNNL